MKKNCRMPERKSGMKKIQGTKSWKLESGRKKILEV